MDLSDILSRLHIKEILDGAKKLVIPAPFRRKKDILTGFVLGNITPEIEENLRNKFAARASTRPGTPLRKRKRDEPQPSATRKSSRVDTDEPNDDGEFLEVPSDTVLKSCYRRFYEATSNAALEHVVCAVCARERGHRLDGVENINLKEIPSPSRLAPHNPHPHHTLLDGMLLSPEGIIREEGRSIANICHECLSDLKKPSLLPPKFSLANNLWVGAVPGELSALTFPEQLLIAHLYPRVYVFKLFPKSGGGSTDGLQRGIRGNVSTYELNVDAMAAMVKGQLMPRPPAVLSSLIAITYIGAGRIPKNWIHSTFRVRRYHVSRALNWLRANNPKYYGGVVISQQQLDQLPEDDVPDEILGVIRQSSDTGLIDQESSGYVRTDEIGDQSGSSHHDTNSASPSRAEDESSPDVIPLQISGSVDCDLSNVTANELMKWGLANLWKDGREGGYAVRHGRQPVSDFPPREVEDAECPADQPNFFERAFPCLYPYGRGGLESQRPVPLDFPEHIRWSLQYWDRRFRKHETFPFITFGISQRRQALTSARIQMKLNTFEREAHTVATITAEKLDRAKAEEERGLPISDEAVRALKKHVYATAARVSGTDQSRYRLRSQIWSTSTVLGPPSLWITINPSDLHDPIAQIFAGEKIDMDKFMSTLGPDKARRAKNVADDPYAAAKFFHFMIITILETLFQVKVTPAQVKSGMGVFGRVAAYFGTVESQGRGTLHLHLLIWLKHVPSPEEISALLKTEAFRNRVLAYIRANFRAYVPGLESAESIATLPHNNEVSYSRPPNPNCEDYDGELQRSELALARMEQVHACKPRRCLVYDKHNQLVCKRRAPFQISEDAFVTDTGLCGPKRLYGYVNSWVPSILINARCNNDGKFLTSGADTKNITFYVTSYAAKKQGKSYNVSAVMADGYAYHLENPKPEYIDSIRDQQRLLLFRLVHSINREQELAGPMVISYLMGWGDVYRSHTYSQIYWGSFTNALYTAFPKLSRRTQPPSSSPTNTVENTSDSQQGEADAQTIDATVTLELSGSGKMIVKSQVIDYQHRGVELEDYNVLDFFVETYETEITKADREAELFNEDTRRGPGRPRNARVRYLTTHPKSGTVHRVIRSPGHRNLPNFLGRWFPRNDDEATYDVYCATMITLLKPWRDLKTDLKLPIEGWAVAFEAFRASATPRVQRALAGIQYFHECESAAQRDTTGPHPYQVPTETQDPDDESGMDHIPRTQEFSEEGLALLKEENVSLREELHGRMAIEIARHLGIFDNEQHDWTVDQHAIPSHATQDDLSRISMWHNLLQSAADKRANVSNTVTPDNIDTATITRSTPLDNPLLDDSAAILLQCAASEQSLLAMDLDHLKPDQLRAYRIVTWHLAETLRGGNIPPLRMVLYGEGGTGKSRVIQTITEAFAVRGVSHTLMKAAYTGVAASLVDGKTTHVIGCISLGSKSDVSDAAKKKLQDFWRNIRYLIIDEYSMLSKSFLAALSRNISIGMEGSQGFQQGMSFGGLNVILCGDLHQFPPVACGKREPLYYPIGMNDQLAQQVGRKIYEEFSTVVILQEQMRVTDNIWRDFLDHLRYGRVESQHLKMLRTLLLKGSMSNSSLACSPNTTPLPDPHRDLGKSANPLVDFSTQPWSDASLITPRHAVRMHWNQAAAQKWCTDSKNHLFVCPALDTIKGSLLTLEERYALATPPKGRKRRDKGLPEVIHLSIGMNVMVTNNLQTDLDITNGARGTVTDIILNPDEPPLSEGSVIMLKYPPECVLVKLSRTRAATLPGLDEGVIPIQRVSTKTQIHVRGKSRTVTRTQFPITGAYAFTDYRAQGQTIPYVVIDIASPPTSGLSLFNLYVALSRSSGRSTIRLLRDFDDSTFLQGHVPELLEEDERLEELDVVTRKWWAKMEG